MQKSRFIFYYAICQNSIKFKNLKTKKTRTRKRGSEGLMGGWFSRSALQGNDVDVGGLWSFWSVNNIEADDLAILQSLDAEFLARFSAQQYLRLSLSRLRKKAKPPFFIEPFYLTGNRNKNHLLLVPCNSKALS